MQEGCTGPGAQQWLSPDRLACSYLQLAPLKGDSIQRLLVTSQFSSFRAKSVISAI
jgi:hypothetical protein